MSERYELPPERLARWLDRWAEAHGGVASRSVDGGVVTLAAGDGAVVACEPPFPPLEGDLLEHVARERTVGVLLVRLGGCAAGVFEGTRLVDSKVDVRLVHGRHRAGGQSANRFARRRTGQARVALAAAADVAVRVLARGPRRASSTRSCRAATGARSARCWRIRGWRWCGRWRWSGCWRWGSRG